jgi:hypothetical protein
MLFSFFAFLGVFAQAFVLEPDPRAHPKQEQSGRETITPGVCCKVRSSRLIIFSLCGLNKQILKK